jgi:hypothetical protein
VAYVHNNGDSSEDLFRFTIVSGDVQTTDIFPVMIDSDSMGFPPDVIHNSRLEIEEGQTATITRSHLLVTV